MKLLKLNDWPIYYSKTLDENEHGSNDYFVIEIG